MWGILIAGFRKYAEGLSALVCGLLFPGKKRMGCELFVCEERRRSRWLVDWLVWMTTIGIPWDLVGEFVGALLLEVPQFSCCYAFPVYFWVSPYTTNVLSLAALICESELQVKHATTTGCAAVRSKHAGARLCVWF